jgi:hypothetical protein
MKFQEKIGFQCTLGLMTWLTFCPHSLITRLDLALRSECDLLIEASSRKNYVHNIVVRTKDYCDLP